MATIKPNEFLEETNPTDNNVEFYSQKNGVSRRLPPSAVAKIVSAKVGGAVATIPGATGNAAAIWNKVVTDPNGDVWFIDAHGNGVKLSGASSPDPNYQKAVGVTGFTIVITFSIVNTGLAARLKVYREGVKLRLNDDFTINSGVITLVIPADNEIFELIYQ